MASENSKDINNLRIIPQIGLFITSYTPLFLIIIIKVIAKNSDFLYWGGFNWYSFQTFLSKFGLVTGATLIILLSFLIVKLTLMNLEASIDNGFLVRVNNVNNKSSEIISYIATYIIPFVYDANEPLDFLIMFLLIAIIFAIYINSPLLIVNPILGLKYGIYEVTFMQNGASKSAIVLSKDKYLLEGNIIKLLSIGHKIYYSKKI